MEMISLAHRPSRTEFAFGRRVGSVIGWSMAVALGLMLWAAIYLIVR